MPPGSPRFSLLIADSSSSVEFTLSMAFGHRRQNPLESPPVEQPAKNRVIGPTAIEIINLRLKINLLSTPTCGN